VFFPTAYESARGRPDLTAAKENLAACVENPPLTRYRSEIRRFSARESSSAPTKPLQRQRKRFCANEGPSAPAKPLQRP